MKRSIFFALILAGATVASSAQTTAKPANTPATAPKAPVATATKLPPGIPPVKAITKTLFVATLRYQDAVVGKGALAEPGKLYTIHYAGYLAADGTKFDSSHDHPEQPVIGKDGKPEMGEDGKPKRAAGQPIQFVQGQGRTIPGFDLGFEGMHIGGKRRLFIPWQLGYGLRGMPSPDGKHVAIPSKANLIFDIELLDVSEPPVRPQPPQRPMGGRPNGMPMRPAQPNPNGQPAQPGQPNPANPNAQPVTPGQPNTPATTPATPSTTPQAATPTPAPTPATPNPTPTPAPSPNPTPAPDQPKQ